MSSFPSDLGVVSGDAPNKDAKSALRDAIHAKLKTSHPPYGMDNHLSESNDSAQAITDIDSMDNDSDSNEDSDGNGGEKVDEKDAINDIPVEERRLRNRLAARKCREKRKQRIQNLEKICSNLECRISILQNEIEGLGEQKQNLSKALENHLCVSFAIKSTTVIANNSRK